MDNAIFARGLQAFQEGLAEAGVTLLVASSGYDSEQELEQITALIGRGADGLLLIGEARSKEAYAFLERRRIPYVIAWNYRTEGKAPFVGFDNKTAAHRMTEQVLKFGHRKIAMIAGVTKNNDRAADRVAGVKSALARAGPPLALSAIVEAPYSLEAGADAFGKLMEATARPTAVICGNDVLAVGAIMKARELRLEIPREVSITSFDDIDLAVVVEPQLTTVHVPHRRMGRAAAKLLLDLCEGKATQGSIELDTSIIARNSLGVAKAK